MEAPEGTPSDAFPQGPCTLLVDEDSQGRVVIFDRATGHLLWTAIGSRHDVFQQYIASLTPEQRNQIAQVISERPFPTADPQTVIERFQAYLTGLTERNNVFKEWLSRGSTRRSVLHELAPGAPWIVDYTDLTQEVWSEGSRDHPADPYAPLAERAGMLAASMWDEPQIAEQYNMAVGIDSTKVESWTNRQTKRAEHILRRFKTHCDGLLALRDLVEAMMPGYEDLFDEKYGLRPRLVALPFSQRIKTWDGGVKAHTTVNADHGRSRVPDLEAVMDRFDEHLKYLSAENASFVAWMKREPLHKKLVQSLGFDPTWGFHYQPELLHRMWRDQMGKTSDPAAGLVEGFGYQAQTIWGTVDRPAFHYNESVLAFRRIEHSLHGRRLNAAKRILRYYWRYCAGHLAFRELVGQLLPGYESHFDKGYGNHPDLKPLPF